MYSSFLCVWLQRELQYLVYHIAKKHFPRSLMLQSNLSFPKHTKLIYAKSGNLFAIFFLSFTLWSNVILHRHFPGWPWRLSISVTNSLFITSLLYEIIVFIYFLFHQTSIPPREQGCFLSCLLLLVQAQAVTALTQNKS